MEKKAITLMMASKKASMKKVTARKFVRPNGLIVRSTKVLITDRRDVPVVRATKNRIRLR